MTTVTFLHGIRTEPTSPVKGLVSYLEAAGFDVRYPDYGYEMELETRLINPMIVGAILPYIGAGDLLVGHSNGCALCYDLLNAGAPAVGAVFINGALETNFVVPPQLKWCDVYWNSGDEVTELAKAGAEIGIVASDWGELGHAGYSGTDLRVTNIDCGSTPGLPAVWGHSDFFTPAKLSQWGPYLAHRIRAATASP